jgi:hypothetical protein
MPKNKSQTINSQQNHAEFSEEAIALNSKKASENPPSLNGVNKNNQT